MLEYIETLRDDIATLEQVAPAVDGDLMESVDLSKQVSIEQLQLDSVNYRFLLEKATSGCFSFDQVSGCVEIWDDSTAEELHDDITRMRKEYESKI